jgi:hypothetical protein
MPGHDGADVLGGKRVCGGMIVEDDFKVKAMMSQQHPAMLMSPHFDPMTTHKIKTKPPERPVVRRWSFGRLRRR